MHEPPIAWIRRLVGMSVQRKQTVIKGHQFNNDAFIVPRSAAQFTLIFFPVRE